jgi:type I restriction enzyme R subunit
LVVLTDRNDLDEQLLGAFAAAQDLIPSPKQAESREDLKNLLRVASGGLIFTTIQKFVPPKGERYPLLSERRNVVVIADEAHRSQYDFIDGFARHLRDGLPNASFIGFTGTPIETGDKITRNVFGDYIDVYDIAQAVEDGATVPIYYEGRLAEISLDPAERPNIDVEFEDVTEAEEDRIKRGLRSKWARIEALVGTDRRLNSIANDIVKHFGDRLAAMDGKAMIVGMSRRICADLYSEIIRLRPEWHSEFDAEGQLKVVMTGNASDAPQLQPHIRNKQRNELIKRRLRDPADPLRLVIVRDMWLTGFDAPCLHTMYIDKPMKGHTLMQAIARVNRVFQGKPGGLVVDYLGLGEALKRAFRDYTDNHGRGEVAIDLDVAVAALQEKVEVVRGILHGFDYSQAFSKNPQAQYQAMAGGLDFILGREDGKNRFIAAVNGLSKAFRLSGATPEALRLRDEVAYFEGLRAGLIKWTPPGKLDVDELDLAVGQIVSRAVMSEGVVDLFAQAGIDRPDISLVSDQFLQEVKELPQRNLAAAALERLLRDEIKVRSRRNIIEARRFSEMLDVTMRKYHNRSIEAAQIIVELVAMAKDFRDLAKRGVDLNLTDDELAFYDALSANQSAIDTIGAETLQAMARELASSLQNSVTVDWAMKESVRAALRLKVKRLLRKYRYPPDQQDAATELVLEQAEVLCETWVPSPL